MKTPSGSEPTPGHTPPAAMARPAGRLHEPRPEKLPRWRGFNLLGMFWHSPEAKGRFDESDLDAIAEWGFDFIRLPLSYRFWASPEDLYAIRDEPLEEIDRVIRLAGERGLHVNLNFHRIPGYCVGKPAEPASLWSDAEMLRAACFHWATFAGRFKGIPNAALTFDLINEPAHVDDANYVRVHKAIIGAIRDRDPSRLIITDGNGYGHEPVPGMIDAGVAMSTRGYHPFPISHHGATWITTTGWPAPAWPLTEAKASGPRVWDKSALRRDRIDPWKQMEARGVGVHIGEWGAYHKTPHDVTLAWMKDNLELFEEAGWGWALWNFRGPFGVVDSHRPDVAYESIRRMQVDPKMLELLRAH